MGRQLQFKAHRVDVFPRGVCAKIALVAQIKVLAEEGADFEARGVEAALAEVESQHVDRQRGEEGAAQSVDEEAAEDGGGALGGVDAAGVASLVEASGGDEQGQVAFVVGRSARQRQVGAREVAAEGEARLDAFARVVAAQWRRCPGDEGAR